MPEDEEQVNAREKEGARFEDPRRIDRLLLRRGMGTRLVCHGDEDGGILAE